MRSAIEWLIVLAFLVLVVAFAATCATRTRAYPLVAACDANNDGVINSADLAKVAAAFGEIGPGDINLDGRVNSADLGWCARLFLRTSYPDDGGPDDASIIATIDAQPPAEQTATVTTDAICPECTPAPTSGAVPTP